METDWGTAFSILSIKLFGSAVAIVMILMAIVSLINHIRYKTRLPNREKVIMIWLILIGIVLLHFLLPGVFS